MDEKEYYKLHHVARRSLELLDQQTIKILNKIPIADLQKIRNLQGEQINSKEVEQILSKHLTESEQNDLAVWTIMKHSIRLQFEEYLPKTEKVKLDDVLLLIDTILKEKKLD